MTSSINVNVRPRFELTTDGTIGYFIVTVKKEEALKKIRPRRRIRRDKIGLSAEKSKITEALLFRTVEELQSGRMPLERQRWSDDVAVGLRITVNFSGLITFAASYDIDNERHHMIIGSLNKERDDYITLEKARQRTKIIKGLAERGVNPQDGLHRRLLREIDEEGLKWEPRVSKPTLRRRA